MKEGERERRRRFDALFDAHSSDIVAYCGWRAGSPSDAEEAVAEVFLTAWRRLDDVPRGDAARVWLYATAWMVIALATPFEESPPTDPEESLVHEALRRLGALDREVLVLSEWEGLSPAQIASVLRCPRVTARGRLHRARRRFRTIFEQLAGEDVRRSASERPAASVTHALGGGS